MGIWIVFVCLACSTWAMDLDTLTDKVTDKVRKAENELIAFIRKEAKFWKAELYPAHLISVFKSTLVKMKYFDIPAGVPVVGGVFGKVKSLFHSAVSHLGRRKRAVAIPESFDARQKWPECKTIGLVHDQWQCGSCWALASAEVMSDRFCIASGGRQRPLLSAKDLISCCKDCNGGSPAAAFQYMIKSGIVTGGLPNDKNTCKPYSWCRSCAAWCPRDICPANPEKKCSDSATCSTPVCSRACDIPRADPTKYFAESVYAVKTVEAIQSEIMINGPVTAALTVYDDFMYYKQGVYQHVSGTNQGGHAIKIIGWGKESGNNYWLAVNTWNIDWGEKGLFKIRKGKNECGVEERVVVGMPKI